jgi:peptidoglycan/xylan/chitin deacetylase (PgdA/CDA1 family)
LEPLVNSLPRSSYTRMMSRQDVQSAARDHEIGVHSFTHESMGFESDKFFQDDFHQCRSYFSETLNLPLDIYAFPNGSYRDSQVDYLLCNGMRHILLVDELLTRRSHRVLTRVTVAADSWPELRLTAVGYRAGRAN